MSDEIKQETEQEQQSEVITPTPKGVTMWNNEQLKNTAWKMATYLSKTDLVPQTYKGKPENCLIAIDISNNTGLPPFTVMQNLYMVQGRPAWSSQMCIALVNKSGRFSPLRFDFVGERGKKDFGCFAYAKDKNGETIIGTTVTLQMATDEGWLQKNGSKWQTMPEQMLRYRAGAFFARAYCPDLLLGIPMADEIQDTYGYDNQQQPTTTITL